MSEPAVKYDVKTEPRIKPRSEDKGTHIVTNIPPHMIADVWGEVREFLIPAVERSHGRWDMNFLLAELVAGNQQLWVAFDKESDCDIGGVMTTRVNEYPLMRFLCMTYVGGKKMNDWIYPMLDAVKEYAKSINCQGREGMARHGFWRWLEGEGFSRSATFYEERFDE